MERTLCNYALIKSLYDQGQDYIDCFWPFAMQVIPKDQFVSESFIQSRLKSELHIEMPLHVVASSVKRSKIKGVIEQQHGAKRYRLADEGEKYLQRLETRKDVERRIRGFAEEMRRFFKENSAELNEEEALRLMLSFVQSNRSWILEFINPSVSGYQARLMKGDPNVRLLVDFMQKVDRAEPENYVTLRDMLLGSLISTTIYARNPTEFDNLARKKFRYCRLYLDTNLVFSILQMHEPEFNKAANELMKLIREFGFDIKVFPSTVSELCYVVRRYRTLFFRYPRDIKVDVIYSGLRRKGWKASDVHEFVTDIESRLESDGISVDWSIDIDLNTFELKNEDLRSALEKYKPGQHTIGQTHDLAAIEAIQRIRGKKARTIEDCKAAFLTSDLRLSRFNFIEMGHKSEGTVCEVLPDRLFTNILWLKNPKLDLPLGTIIATHSRDLFVNRSIWDKFYSVLQDLHKEKEVDDGKVSMLFYHNYIEDVLRRLDDSEVDAITPSFVLGHIQEQAKYIDKIIAVQTRQREQEFLTRLDANIEKAKEEKDGEWLEKVSKIKKKVRRSTFRSTRRRLWAIRVVLALFFVLPALYFLRKGDWNSITKLQSILAIALIAIGIGAGGLNVIWRSLEKRLTSRLYRNRLRQSGLDEYLEESEVNTSI